MGPLAGGASARAGQRSRQTSSASPSASGIPAAVPGLSRSTTLAALSLLSGLCAVPPLGVSGTLPTLFKQEENLIMANHTSYSLTPATCYHLTATEKRHIRALLEQGRSAGQTRRKKYLIEGDTVTIWDYERRVDWYPELGMCWRLKGTAKIVSHQGRAKSPEQVALFPG